MSLVRRVRRLMGTAVAITVPFEHLDAVDPAFDRLAWVERTFSVHRDDSEISRIGAGGLSPADAHPLVQEVLDTCSRLERETAGWFRPSGPDRPLDPSAYVKGWAVDLAADDLIAAGVRSGSVAAGGDIAVIGSQPDGSPWGVGIRDPEGDGALATVDLVDAAIATSGSYERGDHVWNRAGDGYRSVTVVGPSLGTADALATALFADGGTDLSWAGAFDLYAWLVVLANGRLGLTPGMERRLA
ncbi:MAG TPA: FAD:protein FMN transferase [Acidimicrobiia bacterium]|nr:FAD:protein FMN transferase [Acidimicrobiia bacterium]